MLPTPTAKHTRHHYHHYHLHVRASSPDPTSAPSPDRPNLGPLKSIFTPPPFCSAAALQCDKCSIAWRGVQCTSDSNSKPALEDDTRCWPSATATPSKKDGSLSGFGFYSPGLSCPAGYTSACTAVSTTGGGGETLAIQTPAPFDGKFQFPLQAGETAIGCCPTGYACAAYPGNGWQSCYSAAKPASTFAVMDCSSGKMTSTRLQSVPYATVSAVDLWAPLIQIHWQSSDRDTSTSTIPANDVPAIQTTAPVPLVNVPTQTQNAAVTPSSGPAGRNETSPRPPTLSVGAKAGITVGAAFGFILVLSLIFFCLHRRKKDSSANPPPTPTTPYPASSSKPHFLSSLSLLFPSINNSKNTSASGTPDLSKVQQTPSASPHPDPSHKGFEKAPKHISIDTRWFGGGLRVEDALESPIDGRSPFRLTPIPGWASEVDLGGSKRGSRTSKASRASRGSRLALGSENVSDLRNVKEEGNEEMK